jgi:hypothetical protein
MALSPNYGWAEPDNSSLVKNGAQDIRALGDAIDTSLWNVGFGQAGKNKILNGDFGIWQRGTSFANPANFSYFADRFYSVSNNSGGTVTLSRQTFTPGTAPVAGYEGEYYFRSVGASPTGASFNTWGQKIEDVRTFADQTITISFWAKADSSRSVTPKIVQNFGSGGSAEVNTNGSAITLTTSWVRYSQSFTVPSISGKTVGTSSFLALEVSQPVNVSHTLEYWGIQAEYGSKVTPFETATGTIQGELAACQRYYVRWENPNDNYPNFGVGSSISTTVNNVVVVFPTQMRVKPTTLDYSAISSGDGVTGYTGGTFTIGNGGTKNTIVKYTHGSAVFTTYRVAFIYADTNGYLGLSAEL